MNILYIADPNSIHDIKWISSFTQQRHVRAFILPRHVHRIQMKSELPAERLQILPPIPDFSIVRFISTLKTAVRIRKIVKASDIGVIHILYAEPNALWCLFRKYFDVPMIISSRGTDVLRTIPQAFQKKNLINVFVTRAYRLAFKRADFVTATSRLQVESIRNFSGRESRISIVRTGVDLDRLLANTAHHFPLNNEISDFILFPRYIKPLYNHEFCLDAIARLSPDIKRKFKMVFVGKDNIETDLAYQAKLQNRMRAMADVDFEFLPELTQEQIFELYKRSSLVVMTPISDGSPVSAMEAIACGAKVILGPLRYDEEIFGDWTYKISEWNPASLTNLITQCLSMNVNRDVSRFHGLSDRRIEMEKMAKIYEQLTNVSFSIVPTKIESNGSAVQYRQCSRCILDTNDDPAIEFDPHGICSYCRSYEKHELAVVKKGFEGERELQKIVEKIKSSGKGKPYDCIIGISGGVDSTYLALQAKKLGLRPLLVHFDNGWNSELAVSNIERIITKLGFELHTFVVDWEEFKDLQLSFLKASVVDIELVTDHAIITQMYRFALRYGIKYILSGTNVVTEFVLPSHWIHNKKDHINIRAIHRKFGRVPIKTFPLFTSYLKWRCSWAGIQSISLLDYIPYNKKEVKKNISTELGWRDYGGKHYESIFTRFFQGYILPAKFAIDKRKSHLSNLICSGQMTRGEALEEMKKPAYPDDVRADDYEFILKKLDLSEKEFDDIMKLPVKKHTDYPVETDIYQRIPILKLLRGGWYMIRQLRHSD